MIKNFISASAVLWAFSAIPTFAAGLANNAGLTTGIMQQDHRCTGIVKEATGEPAIGASVSIKGHQRGVITDLDGKFSLPNVKKGEVIRITFIGYEPQEIVWDGTPLNITLKDNQHSLNELVVVGYGTQKKVNLTGSVAMVGSEALEDRPVTNVQQALQGEVPGLNLSVSGSGGALDASMSMNIRGTGTIGSGSSASPLILIDGVEGDLSTVNPNDVENISVLKDASSSSIYGARAAFGVILVTTKSGKSGKTHVSYSGNVRFSNGIGIPAMANSVEFANMFNKAQTNDGGSPVFTDDQIQKMQDYMDGKLKYPTEATSNGTWNNWTGAYANTNWFDVFYKDWATSQEHNISLNGGTEKTQWYISGNYLGQNGLLKQGEDKLSRYTLNGKYTAELAPWAKVTYNTRWIRKDYHRPSYMSSLFFHNVARKWPIQPITDPNGHWINENEIEQMRNGGVQRYQEDWYTNQVAFVFEPIKDWHINIDGTMRTYTSFQHWEVLPVYYYDVEGNAIPMQWGMGDNTYMPGQSRVNEYVYKENYYATNIYSDYSKTIGDHYFKVLAGFNAEKYVTRNITGQRDGLITPNVPTLNTATSADQATGGYAHYAVAGFFGRINYSYKDKYLLEANGRYDGSSRFVGDKRWGFFPSFSAGWNIAREEFFENISRATTITTLKLRASWGELGNTNTSSWYPTYQTMNVGQKYGWFINGTTPNYAYNPSLVSPSLTWETIRSWDVGLDFGVFNNRLTGSFDYFVRKTLDMVGPAPELSSVLGTSVPKVNNCDLKSYGFELQISWRDHINDFKYGVTFNLSDAQQEVTRYPNDNGSLSTYYKGYKLGQIWGYTTVGIAQTEQEMRDYLAKVDQSALGSGWGAGDVMYADLNGDGQVNTGSYTVNDPGDLRIIGNNTPRYNFGFTLDAAWKGFDLRMFFQGTMKRDLWLDGTYFWGTSGGMWQSNVFKDHLDYWTAENPNAYYPRPSWTSRSKQTQTRYLQNGAYCRLKNITLGYSLPKKWINKAGMSNVRVYVSGENLWTMTSLSKIFDPENTGTYGYDGSGKTYPLQRTVSVGINVNF